MDDPDVRDLLERGAYGVLSTVGEDGQPYGVPLSYALMGDTVYFHGAGEGHKLDNLGGNPRASLTVVEGVEALPRAFSTRYRSAIAFGRVRLVIDDAERRAALIALLDKYAPENRERGLRYLEAEFERVVVLALDIERATGKQRR